VGAEEQQTYDECDECPQDRVPRQEDREKSRDAF